MALKAGVRVVSGSDASALGGYCEISAQELQLTVNAFMSEMYVIIAATRMASECCGLERLSGTIECGKIADIIEGMGNPLIDISVLKDVRFVMKEVEIIKQFY